MTKHKKPGFGGQWLKTFTVGEHVGVLKDGKKKKIQVTPDFINKLASNYDVSLHEAPATIGHPEHDAPAFGWISGARVNSDGDALEIQFADTQPEFEEMVNKGLFKKRSLKLYMGDDAPGGKAPYIRHCAFLGAMPPAIKGLPDVQFKEDEGETITFDIEFSEGEVMTTQTTVDDQQVENAVLKYLKDKLGIGKKDEAASASFSEADLTKTIDGAIKAAVDPLKTQITSLETENKDLKTQVAGIGTNTTRGELVSFCESLEAAGTLPRSFRNMGGVAFLEAVASLPAEKKVQTIEFAEETVNGVKTQVEKETEIAPLDFMKKFLSSMRYVQFGEAFADVKPNGDGSDLVNPERLKGMRAAAGLPAAAKKD